MVTKKIKDLTLKEFYLWLIKQVEVAKTLCLRGENPIDCFRKISITQYLKEKGDMEVEVPEE